MKHFPMITAALLLTGLFVAPAFAQHPQERADQPLEAGQDSFADDGEFDGNWGEGWEEDPFDAEANAEWQEGAESAAHEEAHFDALELAASVTNFLIWLALVIFLARKPLAAFLENRRLGVEEGLAEAKDLKEAAEKKYEDYSRRLEHLDEELEKLRFEMVQAGETERDRILADADARAARMRKDSSFIIQQQMKQLRTDLTREAINAAVNAAEKVLTEQVKDADQTRLAQDYLGRLEVSMKDEVRA